MMSSRQWCMLEVESIINSRPLTYLSPGDLDEPLTLSHLLVGRRLINLPDYCAGSDDEAFNCDREVFMRREKFLEGLLCGFWKRWKHEYLLELRDAHLSSKKKVLKETKCR